MSSLCWKCGGRFRPHRGAVVSVSRFVDGNRVELHKECAERYDRAQRPNPVNLPAPRERVEGDDDMLMPGYYRAIRPLDESYDLDPAEPLDFHAGETR